MVKGRWERTVQADFGPLAITVTYNVYSANTHRQARTTTCTRLVRRMGPAVVVISP